MIAIQLLISVVESINLYNGIHRNCVELLQICVCSINIEITLLTLLSLLCMVKHNCHYNHIQYLHSDAFKYMFFCQSSQTLKYNSLPNHFLSHFRLQPSSGSHPYSGTSIQVQIPCAWFKILLSFLLYGRNVPKCSGHERNDFYGLIVSSLIPEEGDTSLYV